MQIKKKIIISLATITLIIAAIAFSLNNHRTQALSKKTDNSKNNIKTTNHPHNKYSFQHVDQILGQDILKNKSINNKKPLSKKSTTVNNSTVIDFITQPYCKAVQNVPFEQTF